jgi:hypothetical protein
MAGIEAEVLETFLAQLAQCSDVPDSLVSNVGELLAADKLPKPDQLADLYAKAAGESAL